MLKNKMIEPFYLFIYLTSQQCSVLEPKGCFAEANLSTSQYCRLSAQ